MFWACDNACLQTVIDHYLFWNAIMNAFIFWKNSNELNNSRQKENNRLCEKTKNKSAWLLFQQEIYIQSQRRNRQPSDGYYGWHRYRQVFYFQEICCPSNCDLTLIYCVSACSDSKPAVGPRLCILKREEGETYGFHLRVEKSHQGHIIRNVVSGGVGERCGLRDGDRLLEVNNCYVDDLPHPEVKAYDSVTLIQGLYKNKHKGGIFIFFRWPGK